MFKEINQFFKKKFVKRKIILIEKSLKNLNFSEEEIKDVMLHVLKISQIKYNTKILSIIKERRKKMIKLFKIIIPNCCSCEWNKYSLKENQSLMFFNICLAQAGKDSKEVYNNKLCKYLYSNKEGMIKESVECLKKKHV